MQTFKKPTKMSKCNFYKTGQLYQHFSGYIAKYTGRGYRNKHTYEVVDPAGSTFAAGAKFTPNEPEKYFKILL